MLICKVIGHVWATKKEEGLEGLKLMVVQEIDGNGRKKGSTFVAADVVGAGIGEQVLTVSGKYGTKGFWKRYSAGGCCDCGHYRYC